MKAGPHYISNMPNLVKCNKMEYDTVLAYLSNLAQSVYVGWEKEEIRCTINESDGRRYLAELILLNEQNKAELDIISSKGTFEESCSKQLLKSPNL